METKRDKPGTGTGFEEIKCEKLEKLGTVTYYEEIK